MSGGMKDSRPSPADSIDRQRIGAPDPCLLLVEGQEPAIEQIGDGDENETPVAENEAERAVEGTRRRRSTTQSRDLHADDPDTMISTIRKAVAPTAICARISFSR